jgi:hypothetical protein
LPPSRSILGEIEINQYYASQLKEKLNAFKPLPIPSLAGEPEHARQENFGLYFETDEIRFIHKLPADEQQNYLLSVYENRLLHIEILKQKLEEKLGDHGNMLEDGACDDDYEVLPFEILNAVFENDETRLLEWLGTSSSIIKKKVGARNPHFDDITLLHAAVMYNNLPMSLLLLQLGADVNAKNELGLTPLFFACSSEEQDDALLLTLLKWGADKDMELDGELTLQQVAKDNGKWGLLNLAQTSLGGREIVGHDELFHNRRGTRIMRNFFVTEEPSARQ